MGNSYGWHMWAVGTGWFSGKGEVRDTWLVQNALSIELDADFQRMCHIYHIFNKTVVNITIEDVSGSADGNSGSLIPL